MYFHISGLLFCIDILYCFIQQIFINRHLYAWTIMNKTAKKNIVQIILLTYIAVSSSYITESEVLILNNKQYQLLIFFHL